MVGWHYSASYDWMWSMFPFGRASKVQIPPCAGNLRSWRVPLPVHSFLRDKQCGARYRLMTGGRDSCYGRWCHSSFQGGFDRATAFLLKNSETLRSFSTRRVVNVSRPALAVWHLRTGDISLFLQRSTVARVWGLIHHGLAHRGVEHKVRIPEGIGEAIAPMRQTDGPLMGMACTSLCFRRCAFLTRLSLGQTSSMAHVHVSSTHVHVSGTDIQQGAVDWRPSMAERFATLEWHTGAGAGCYKRQ